MNQESSKVRASYWIPDVESSATGNVISQSSPEQIDSSVFTHLLCAFANLNAKTNRVFISDAHEDQLLTFTNTVKKKSPHVKTLLSIGGRNADKSAFASMASNSAARKSFIWSSIRLARTKGFRGLNLAWEYPNNEVEMNNFGKLLEEWRDVIDFEAEQTEICIPLLLTASVYYFSDYNSVSYPIQDIKKNLDWVNIIAYDFETSSTRVGPPVALYDPANPEGLCGKSGLKQWIKAGLRKKKVVFGFPYVVSQILNTNKSLSSSSQDVQTTTGPPEANQPKQNKRKTCERNKGTKKARRLQKRLDALSSQGGE